MEFLARGIGNAAGLWLAVALISGLSVPVAPSLAGAALNFLVIGFVLAAVNSIVKPVAHVLAFPLYLLTFGLFALIVNGLMLTLASGITDALTSAATSASFGLHVESFGAAIWGSIVVSIVSSIIVGVLGAKRA